jgi:DNA polymerase bacteriophage-type
MRILHRDFETRSVAELREVGAHVYAAHPSTSVLCCAYTVDDGPIKWWTPEMPVPPEFFEAAASPDWLVVAHNDAFERVIEQHVLAPRYGWPLVPIERHRCTLASAHARALPGELEKLALALGTQHQKDMAGHRIMQRLCKPRRARKDEDPNGIYWDDDPEKFALLYRYCEQDVAVEREVCERIGFLSVPEQEVWLLDAVINNRGLCIDHALLTPALLVAEQAKEAIQDEIAEVTSGAVITIGQVERLGRWLREQHNWPLPNLQAETLEEELEREDLPLLVRRAIRLRLDGAQAAASKLAKLPNRCGADGRLRGALTYHGASTGRFTSRGFQAHNLKKAETEDLQAAIDAVSGGSLQHVKERFASPLAMIGDLGRALIAAPPEHQIFAGDFSAIESRVLAWLAGEHWKLEAYRKYDEAADAEFEPYCVMASKALKRKVTPDDKAGRNFGKTFDLSFGYGGGLGAWRKFDDSDTYSNAEVEQFKHAFRNSHPATKRFWYALEKAVHRCAATRQRVSLNNQFSFEMDQGTLLLTLPSGRQLSYPEARVVPGKFEGSRELKYKDNSKGRWADCSAWYGTLVENVVQATARDIMVAAMLRLERAGYPVILTVHDEIVCEVPQGFGSKEEFHRILTTPPGWAEGLPIAAKSRNGKRFAKIKHVERPQAAEGVAYA